MVFPLSLFLMKPHITQKLLDDSSQKKKAYFPNFPHKYMDKFTIVKHPQKYITLCVYIYIYIVRNATTLTSFPYAPLRH